MKLLPSIFLFTILFLSSFSDVYSSDIIASWDRGQITVDDYKDFALYVKFENDSSIAAKSSLKERTKLLNIQINFELIKTLADSLRLDTLKAMRDNYQARLRAVSRKLHLLPDSTRRKVFSDKLVEETYNKMKLEYKVSHILLMADNSNNSFPKIKIDSIYLEIINDPSSFSNIAQKFSDDKISGVKGGNLGWSLPSNYIPKFEEEILKLQIGKISKPFHTQYGWHVAKTTAIRENRLLGSFGKEKYNIIKILKNKYKTEYDRATNDFREFLFNKYHVKINKDNVTKFRIAFNRLLTTGDESYFLDINEKRVKVVISTLKNDSVFVKDMFKYVSNIKENISDENIIQFIYNNFQKRLLDLATRDLGYRNRPEVISLVKEGILLDYKEYFTDKFSGNKDLELKWFKKLYNKFNVRINYYLLEEIFYIVEDDKK